MIERETLCPGTQDAITVTVLGAEFAQQPDNFLDPQDLVAAGGRYRRGRLEAGTFGSTGIHPVFPGNHAA